ncbi:hypothetical protein ASPCAL12444 [Aspergillus calidoustus]|uniref:F-box domain-containing protein n=1 Tax=Aspergillus calidoustus TaxID=454130 RepID=A0A0U5CFS5_ASPCI|nr:hypothetical protein ASPCAL12444 [Aspergillus calidoustus]
MPDPSTLPREIFLQIIYDAVGGKPDQWMYCYNILPADLCLINWNWYHTLNPVLYSRFEFNGSGDDTKALWGFFRAIILRPELAGHIRMLRLTSESKPARPPKTAGLYRRSAKLVQRAITQAGLGHVGDAEAELRQADHRALVALILAHAPNLAMLQLHVAREDSWLDTILAHAIASRDKDRSDTPEAVAFQSLRTLYLASAETPPINARRTYQSREVSYPARMNKQRAFLRLPNLQELQLIDAQLDDDLSTLEPEENSLTQLTIAFRSPVENLQPVLDYTTKLTHLSLSLSITGRHYDLQMHHDMWNALLPLRNQLVYLDIYSPEMNKDPEGCESERTPRTELFKSYSHLSFCCPLRRFLKIRQLSITPLLLLGHNCRHETPLKFVNHLPPNCESFALYGGERSWILSYIEKLAEEMALIPHNNPPLRLNSIVVDAPWPPTWSGRLPYGSMVGICKEKRIMFNTAGRDFLFYGGENTHFAKVTHNAALGAASREEWLVRRKARDVMPRGIEVDGEKGTLDEDWV